jgi:hypothetical protein
MSCLGTNRLMQLYHSLSNVPNNDIRFRINIERPEQELIAKFLPHDCCVLEMGGESGTTALIIDKLLKDPTKHVLVEPSSNSIPKLQNVKNIYDTSFHVVNGFVGRNREEHEKLWTECKDRKMYDLQELEQLVDQQFDVMVIDCEGAFYNIVHDIPEILDSVKLLIIELDGPDDKVPYLREFIKSKHFELVHSQTHPYLNNGDVNNLDFGVINNTNELHKLKCRKNMIGFHEVYVKF